MNDIDSGRITRSKTRLANYCEHYSFISIIEPMKVEEALDDPGWVNAMHEELHNFERNQVCTLVEKPDDNHNVIGTKWVFGISKMRVDKFYATRPISSLKDTIKLRYGLW